MINFISHLEPNLRSGGFSAMNSAALSALSAYSAIHYVGPINPTIERWRKVLSKAIRLAGARGDFFFYSRKRLAAIATDVQKSCRADASADFFHGFTPWIATRPQRPYLAWSDCTFHDYIEIYHRSTKFRKGDIARIATAEAAWLNGAVGVAFTSRWAARRAIERYGLDSNRVEIVGIFGEIELPEFDSYSHGSNFAFISTNFAAKGGAEVLSAFRNVQARFPSASLTVVGDRPKGLSDSRGVTVVGFLRKEVPAEYRRLQDILRSARAIVHPTRSDIAPLLAVEAAYFGCPVISTRRFAIPEIIIDGKTGLLVDDPSDSQAIEQAMEWMLNATEAYSEMRHAAWSNSRRYFTKEKFEARLLEWVKGVVKGL